MGSVESIALNLLLFFAGFFIGNRLAIGRDKRREFNSLIDPIRTSLLITKNRPNNRLPDNYLITFELIRERLHSWQRRGFDRAVEAYKESKGDGNRGHDDMGGFVYKDKALIVHAAEALLKYLKPR